MARVTPFLAQTCNYKMNFPLHLIHVLLEPWEDKGCNHGNSGPGWIQTATEATFLVNQPPKFLQIYNIYIHNIRIYVYTQYTYICIYIHNICIYVYIYIHNIHIYVYIYTICVYMYAIPMKDRKDITRPVNVAERACNQCSIFSMVQ